MIKPLNNVMQHIATFNFGIGFGNKVFACTIQVWPFVWGLSISKSSGVFETRIGPITVSFVTQQNV
jgi:hypothetical protein